MYCNLYDCPLKFKRVSSLYLAHQMKTNGIQWNSIKFYPLKQSRLIKCDENNWIKESIRSDRFWCWQNLCTDSDFGRLGTGRWVHCPAKSYFQHQSDFPTWTTREPSLFSCLATFHKKLHLGYLTGQNDCSSHPTTSCNRQTDGSISTNSTEIIKAPKRPEKRKTMTDDI